MRVGADNERMTRQRWDLHPSANHFTLLRLVLAIIVVGVHSFTLLVPLPERASIHWAEVLGELAVSGFFAVSGCLISASWTRSPNFGAYILKRVLRIYPGYLAAGMVCAFGFAALGVPDVRAYYANLSLPKYALDLLRLTMIQTPGAFAANPDPYLNGSSWTILMEFWCYLLVPVVALAGAKRVPRIIGLLLGIFLTLYALQLFWPHGGWWAPDHDSTWHELRIPLPILWQGRWPRLLSAFWAGAAFITYRDRIPHCKTWAAICTGALLAASFRESLFLLLWPICGSYLLFWFAWHPKIRSPKWMERQDLSYGTYLYAFPVQQVLVRHVLGITPGVLFLIALPLALGCGWGSWRLVELPALKWKPRAKTVAPDGR